MTPGAQSAGLNPRFRASAAAFSATFKARHEEMCLRGGEESPDLQERSA